MGHGRPRVFIEVQSLAKGRSRWVENDPVRPAAAHLAWRHGAAHGSTGAMECDAEIGQRSCRSRPVPQHCRVSRAGALVSRRAPYGPLRPASKAGSFSVGSAAALLIGAHGNPFSTRTNCAADTRD